VHFAFLLLPDFTHLALSCAIESLRLSNLVSGRRLFRWTLLSEDGRSATCSNGTVTLTDGGLDRLHRADRLFVVAGNDVQRHLSSAVLAFLRRERAAGTPLGGICSGAYVLARAGLLSGIETCVHWSYHDIFAEQFPDVPLRRGVFAADGPVLTAAGGTAAADLMLHLVAREHGRDLALAVADQMLYSGLREAGAAQRISLGGRHGSRNRHLARAVEIMQSSLEAPPRPCEIAEDLGISVRQLERLFMRYLGTTPKRYQTELRLERARNLVMQTELSIIEIAMACGFTSPSHFSKLYRSRFGISPGSSRTGTVTSTQNPFRAGICRVRSAPVGPQQNARFTA
jgi:transcriptional regulator GlxA family with amidase domain